MPPIWPCTLAARRLETEVIRMRKNHRPHLRAVHASPRARLVSKPRPFRNFQRRPGWGTVRLVGLGAVLLALIGVTGWGWLADRSVGGKSFECKTVEVIDGDTFRCDGRRIRLQGIDAPELAGHCRPGRRCTPGDGIASSESLSRLVAWKAVQCEPINVDRYGRTVARCTAAAKDLSCAQLEAGQAVRRYGWITC